jgi:RNA polymerase sigma factor (sigma-70 family)
MAGLMSNYQQDEEKLNRLQTGNHVDWKQAYDDWRTPFLLYFHQQGVVDRDQVLTLFQDAMVVMFHNITTHKLEAPLHSELRTYLFGIGKRLYWRMKGEAAKAWKDDIPEIPVAPEVEDKEEQRHRADLVRRLLSQIGEPCRTVLDMFYLRGYSMEALAEEMELPSEGAARKKKFDCLKKMRDLL